MIPYFYAIDEFFPEEEFELLKAYAQQLKYTDVIAPFDGVTYRNIGLPVPNVVEERVAMTLTWLMGYKVIPKHMAFRLSLEGSEPPQWAHSDGEVSRYAMFAYINNGPGGTVLLRHRDNGMFRHPRSEEELQLWQQDYNDESKWEVHAAVDCAPNRAIILRAELMHAALPKGGFGTDVTNGRLILLSFFD